MGYSIAGFAMMLIAAIPLLPWPAVRARAISLLHFKLHVVLLAAVVACGVFFLRPSWAPQTLVGALEPLSSRIASWLPAGQADLSWLAIGGVLALIGWPLLAVVDFASRVSFQTALLRRLLGDIRDSARSLEQAIAQESEPAASARKARVADAQSAIQTMDYVATGNNSGKKRRPLIELLS